MKVTLPIIGQVQIGEPTPTKQPKQKKDKGFAALGAGFLDLGDKPLSSEKDVSTKLVKSFFSWVYANVSVLAEEISKIDFEMYKVTLLKGDTNFQEVTNHPLLDLLDRPNPFTTTSQLVYLTEAHLELTGDAFWLLDSPTNPKTIFILPPDKITVHPGDSTDEYLIKNYEFKDRIDGKAVSVKYDPDVIIHFKTPNPDNPYRGKSVVEAAALSIDNSNLSRQFLKMFFINGAVPNFALSSDSRITEDDIKRIEAQLRKQYGGVRNAFKTLILGGGLKPVTVQQTGQQMQLLELMTAMRDEIMAMFKNTKASLGITDDVNRANAEATLLGWKQSVIKPKMMRITDTINEFLAPKFGTNLLIGFEDPVPENREAIIAEIKELVSSAQTQIMTVNEAREMIGLDPLEGEEFNTVNNRPVMAIPDLTPKALKNISLKKMMRRKDTAEWLDMQKNIYQAAKVVAEKLVKAKKKTKTKQADEPMARNYNDFTAAEAKDYWQKHKNITGVADKRFAEKISRFLSELEEKAVRNLHHAVPKTAKKVKAFDLFDQDEEVQAGIDLFTPLSIEIAEMAGVEAYRLLKLNTVYSASRSLRDGVAKSVEKFTQSFLETDRQKLTDILTNAIQQGLSVPDTEKAIREQFGEFRKNQSEKIARTEILRSSTAGQLDAFQQSNVVIGKQWYNGAPCPECEPYDGEIVYSVEGSFYSSDSEFQDGDPPLHPNCRCVLLPVLGDEESKQLKDELAKTKQELEENRKYITELEKVAGVANE